MSSHMQECTFNRICDDCRAALKDAKIEFTDVNETTIVVKGCADTLTKARDILRPLQEAARKASAGTAAAPASEPAKEEPAPKAEVKAAPAKK